MIKKSLFTAFVLLVAYHFMLPHISHRFFEFLGQQRDNYAKAQRYVYDVPIGTKVIVGSSMSDMLDNEVLGPGYYKLTLAGSSALTCLEIVQRSNKRPTVVLIEINVLHRDRDKEFLDDLFSPPFYQLRQHFEMFREKGRPADFVGGLAEAGVRKVCKYTARVLYGSGPSISSAPEGATPALRTKLLQIEREARDFTPAHEMLKKRTDQLGDYVDALTRQGVTCILFEMPIDASLSNLTAPNLWRQALNERFPPAKYHWLNFDHSRNYETRDGVHLIPAEAHRVSQVVVDYVNRVTDQTAGTTAIR